MKKLTLSEWEEKYIVGPVERFDQKYGMYKRTSWDPEIKELLKNWSFLGEIGEKPGYTLKDFALRRASQRVTRMFALSNMSKPNPTSVAKAITAAIEASHPGGMREAVIRPPEDAAWRRASGRSGLPRARARRSPWPDALCCGASGGR